MYFSFNLNNTKLIGELLYIKDEYSLLYEPFCENVGVSIMLGSYTSLDTICETGVVAHVSGYNSKETWTNREMDVPKTKKGYLIAHFDDPPIKGTGIDYDGTWNTYYDRISNYVCIGDYHTKSTDVCIEFANKVVAVLRGDQLVAVWAKIKEV